MSIEDIIDKLPEEYQELAQRYLPVLTQMTFDELENWVNLLAEGNWQAAYRNLVGKMSTDELIAETVKVNEQIKELNEENAETIAMQKNIIKEILLIALNILKSKAEQ
jgi:hypothetical protein